MNDIIDESKPKNDTNIKRKEDSSSSTKQQEIKEKRLMNSLNSLSLMMY